MSTERILRHLPGVARRAASAALMLGLLSGAAEAADFQVELNHSKALYLPAPVATVMVSNPAIADVSIQGSKLLYVLARSYGRTDFIALNAEGKQVAHFDIDVIAPKTSAVTLLRGTAQTTYSCTPRCEPVPDPSDGREAFNTAMGQSMAMRAMGSSSAMAPTGSGGGNQ